MEIGKYTLYKLRKEEAIPFSLLLLADETKDAIEKYIYDSVIYTVFSNECIDPIGVFALNKINDQTIEIKNIALSAAYRNQGIGSYLLGQINEIARTEHYYEIIVGTASIGAKEILFYEKNRFIKYDVKKNFYIDNYSFPIYDNGIQLTDMAMLKTTVI